LKDNKEQMQEIFGENSSKVVQLEEVVKNFGKKG